MTPSVALWLCSALFCALGRCCHLWHHHLDDDDDDQDDGEGEDDDDDDDDHDDGDEKDDDDDNDNEYDDDHPISPGKVVSIIKDSGLSATSTLP